MTVLAGSGTSRLPEAFAAGQAAAEQATIPLQGATPSLVLVFSTDIYDQSTVIAGVRSVTGSAPLTGCCTGGIISAAGPSATGVSVLVLHSPALEVQSALVENLGSDPVGVAEAAAEHVEEFVRANGAQPSVALMFADGLTASLTEAVRSAGSVLGPLCRMVGGGAGDNLRFKETSVFLNDRCASDAFTISLLNDELPIGIGIQHGWIPVGRGMVVTRSEGRIVHEFDGQPALEAYRNLFPEAHLSPENFTEFVMAHPIGLPQAGGEFLVRDPIRANPDGSISFIATVPEHAVAHIMRGDPDTLFAAAENATQRAIAQLNGAPLVAVVVFDCVSRLLMLRAGAKTEIQRIRTIAGESTPIAGMFSFGEIAAEYGPAAFHNKTVVVYAIGQKQSA